MNLLVNPEQKKAMEHERGPALVIAPPGSGKTFVIIKRLQRLIEKNVSPDKILVITFTKAAAEEMQQRYLKERKQMSLNSVSKNNITFQTFHSYFLSILVQFFGFQSSCILQLEEKIQYIKQIYHNATKEQQQLLNPTTEGFQLLFLEFRKMEKHSLPSEYSEYYIAYKQLKEENRKLDLDDLLTITQRKLRENPKILQKIQEQYEYFIIDEFQDADQSQIDLIIKIAVHENIFCVGDDDQAIYGFRGVNQNIMNYFRELLTKTSVYYLTVNYRSRKEIIEFATHFISHNGYRYKKEIESGINYESASTSIAAVRTGVYESKELELGAIQKHIKSIQDIKETKQAACITIAFLFRTNTELRKYEALLQQTSDDKVSLNTKFKDSEMKIVKDLLKDFCCYLKLSMNHRDVFSFLQIMNKPQRYFQRKDVQEPFFLDDFILQMKRKPGFSHTTERFVHDLKMISNLTPFASFQYFLHKIYSIDEIVKKEDKNNITILQQALTQCKHMMREYQTVSNFVSCMDQFVDELKESMKDNMNSLGEKKTLNSNYQFVFSTYHGSKGLEYNHVIIPGINHGLVPHKKARTMEELEEERRMLYVAMTRAKESLFITSVRGKNEKSQKPSDFWEEFYSSTISSNSL